MKQGMVSCSRCNGVGNIEYKAGGNLSVSRECTKCKGTGTLDWIENIVGKKTPDLVWDSPTLTHDILDAQKYIEMYKQEYQMSFNYNNVIKREQV